MDEALQLIPGFKGPWDDFCKLPTIPSFERVVMRVLNVVIKRQHHMAWIDSSIRASWRRMGLVDRKYHTVEENVDREE